MDHGFLQWLSAYLQADKAKVRKLLDDELSRYFLIVWSIYEAKCFNGFVKPEKFHDFANDVKGKTSTEFINEQAEYFHNRYQDKGKRSNLLHQKDNRAFSRMTERKFADLNNEDKIYLLLFVTYRYRNNIFHGNKGIASWLKFDEQIRKCVSILQHFIDASTVGKQV